MSLMPAPAPLPLRSLDAFPNNLPVQATPLIGRQHEAQAVERLLRRDDVRLLTLTGPAGAGKTRLALQVAANLTADFPDGVYFLPLAAIADPGLVASAIAQTLGILETTGRPIVETLRQQVRDRRLLLVLDNFEQLLAAAPLVADLLAASALLKIVVTSRAALRLYGEHEFSVPPLAVPDAGRPPHANVMSQYEAVRLFVERAQAARADFALTDENAAAVADICRRLDGLPLALELAAARIKVLPPAALLARLGNRLALLTSGPLDRPPRQRTLRAALDWSYELLTPDVQRLFRRFAAFVDGCTLAAAEAIAGDGPFTSQVAGAAGAQPEAPSVEAGILDGLQSLVDNSLLKPVDADGAPRFMMLESIREYALERLIASGEAPAVWRRHAAVFLDMIEAAEPALHGPEQAAWLDRLEREHANIRAALRWVVTTGDPADAQRGLLAAGALWTFWYFRGLLVDGRRLLAALLAAPAAAGAARAKALSAAAILAWAQGDQGAAQPLSEECLAIARSVGDQRVLADALFSRAMAAFAAGDLTAARTWHEQSLAIRRAVGDRWELSLSTNNLARALHDLGELPRASELYREALALRREMGDCRNTAATLWCLGELMQDQGDLTGAHACYTEAVPMALASGDRWSVARLVVGFGGLAAAWGQPERALRLDGAATAADEALGVVLFAPWRARRDRWLEAARRALGHEAVSKAWAAGRAMSLQEAIAEALAIEPGTSEQAAQAALLPSVPDAASLGAHGTPALPLTRREREVAALVARGYTNREIATALIIADRTAETHVEHILGKLGLASRAQIAVWAASHGLLATAQG